MLSAPSIRPIGSNDAIVGPAKLRKPRRESQLPPRVQPKVIFMVGHLLYPADQRALDPIQSGDI
jgi:hypothetical protein